MEKDDACILHSCICYFKPPSRLLGAQVHFTCSIPIFDSLRSLSSKTLLETQEYKDELLNNHLGLINGENVW